MTADGHPDGRLFDLYREYIGEPDETRDVYAGFGLFLGGIGLAIVALAIFVVASSLFEPRNYPFLTWAEVAYALGMLSLPTTMLGIVVLLPAERRVIAGSVGGAAIAVVAVGGFVWLYPDWNFYESSDAAFTTVHVVGTYAVGLAAITASTGAALIAHYLDLAREVETLEASADDEAGESYSDEEIRSDIDDAMEGVELSWGGVEKTENTRLSFDDHEFEGSHLEFDAKTTRSSGVDQQVAGLKGLKGGDTKTTTSSETVDEQTQKLRELRQQQQEDEAPAPDAAGTNPLERLVARVRSLF